MEKQYPVNKWGRTIEQCKQTGGGREQGEEEKDMREDGEKEEEEEKGEKEEERQVEEERQRKRRGERTDSRQGLPGAMEGGRVQKGGYIQGKTQCQSRFHGRAHVSKLNQLYSQMGSVYRVNFISIKQLLKKVESLN